MEDTVWLEKNKVIARRFRRELWNTGDLALADQIIAPDCTIHGRIPFLTDFVSGPEPLKQLVSFYHMTLSDITMTVEEVVAEGDTVAVRWSARGRHTGDLLGVPASGREVKTNGIDMLRIVDGRIVEGWVSWDALSMLEQILARPDGGAGTGEQSSVSDFIALISRLAGHET